MIVLGSMMMTLVAMVTVYNIPRTCNNDFYNTHSVETGYIVTEETKLASWTLRCIDSFHKIE